MKLKIKNLLFFDFFVTFLNDLKQIEIRNCFLTLNIIQSDDKEGFQFMGKCKRRNGNKPVLDHILTRENVVAEVVYNLKNNSVDEEIRKLILLFGIAEDELTEAGATFEEVLKLKKF